MNHVKIRKSKIYSPEKDAPKTTYYYYDPLCVYNVTSTVRCILLHNNLFTRIKINVELHTKIKGFIIHTK